MKLKLLEKKPFTVFSEAKSYKLYSRSKYYVKVVNYHSLMNFYPNILSNKIEEFFDFWPKNKNNWNISITKLVNNNNKRIFLKSTLILYFASKLYKQFLRSKSCASKSNLHANRFTCCNNMFMPRSNTKVMCARLRKAFALKRPIERMCVSDTLCK